MAKILFIDQYALMGGAQRILVDLAAGFLAAGHSGQALLPGDGPVAQLLSAAGVQTGTYRLMALRAGKKSTFERLRYITGATKTARSIRRSAAGPFDFVFVNGPRAILPATLAARRMRLPLVAAVHLIHEGIERRLLRWCFARPHVKVVSFCSPYAAEPFGDIGSKGRIIPNWVALEFLSTPSHRPQARGELGIGNDEIAVGVLGRVSRTKGQRLFLEAAMPLLEDHPNLRLLLAGGADFEDSQEEIDLRALTEPVRSRVTFHDKARALAFLDALDISVVPSIRPESFGLVAVESMARGVPVIATRRGGLQSTVVDRETGFLVEPEEREMRTAIANLAGNSSLRARMGEAGSARAAAEYDPKILIPRAVSTIVEALT